MTWKAPIDESEERHGDGEIPALDLSGTKRRQAAGQRMDRWIRNTWSSWTVTRVRSSAAGRWNRLRRPPRCGVTVLVACLITDGPFAESKEALGGYYLIEAADLGRGAGDRESGCPRPTAGWRFGPSGRRADECGCQLGGRGGGRGRPPARVGLRPGSYRSSGWRPRLGRGSRSRRLRQCPDHLGCARHPGESRSLVDDGCASTVRSMFADVRRPHRRALPKLPRPRPR